jgi:hypothetical protein
MQTFTLSVGDTKTVTFVPVDSANDPGSYVPGGGSWQSDNAAVASITPLTDLTATLKCLAPGVANITDTLQSSLDGVPGANVGTSFQVVVSGGAVVGGTFSLS